MKQTNFADERSADRPSILLVDSIAPEKGGQHFLVSQKRHLSGRMQEQCVLSKYMRKPSQVPSQSYRRRRYRPVSSPLIIHCYDNCNFELMTSIFFIVSILFFIESLFPHNHGVNRFFYFRNYMLNSTVNYFSQNKRFFSIGNKVMIAIKSENRILFTFDMEKRVMIKTTTVKRNAKFSTRIVGKVV